MIERLERTVEFIKLKTKVKPEIAIVLGSGLGGFAEKIEVSDVVEYSEIVGFPISTVEGHKGRFIFGTLGGKSVVCMQGRVHYYEGYSMQDVVMPIRIMAMLGAGKLILTNASGGINKDYKPGDLMLIKDQIGSFVPNPLIGENIEKLGTRFPDMSEIYSRNLINIAKQSAKECGIDLKEGVYAQLSGPSYESPAEVNMLRILGADAVAMSTACEAIAAKHAGMEICGISCITNVAVDIMTKKLEHTEVTETANKASDKLELLITAMIEKL